MNTSHFGHNTPRWLVTLSYHYDGRQVIVGHHVKAVSSVAAAIGHVGRQLARRQPATLRCSLG